MLAPNITSFLSLILAAISFPPTALALLIPPPQDIYNNGDKSGCGVAHPLSDLGITIPRTLQSSGVTRSYGIHLPPSYNKTKSYPLILGFHGSQSIGLFLELDSDLDSYTHDKIIVYPDGLGGAWAGPSYASTTLHQDLAFVRDLLADLRGRYCIDSARTYALGFSNGGGFVDSIACDESVGAEFAAFAAVSGAFYTDTETCKSRCRPARSPLPLLEFHGGADEDVRYAGGQGEGGIEPPIMEWLGYWVSRNKCDTAPNVTDSFNNDVHHYSWTCQGRTGVLQHYKTDGQKHDWPSTEPNFSQAVAGDKPTHINASDIIIKFFDQYTRPA